MSGWHCYMLECADGTLYTGITNDLGKRLAAHNSGTASKCTRSRLPVKLVFTEDQPDRAAASRREIEIKRLPRSAKLALLFQRNGVLPESEKK
ncbi:GIY-YIG nuclease family protein [Sulfuricella sp.]|uniref:GIY-YIG nuclease family protein n=1 Tax=Sulfuricella sp. TaxID=2099377 RepID=UPI002B7CC36B|nr:GIY-YIG nuclease family protein [Sulfuricella sp.]HUX62553.1 GIY-YIG nuclease family protein [Sulfuricella sp.]